MTQTETGIPEPWDKYEHESQLHANKAEQCDERLYDGRERNEWDIKLVDDRLYHATMANYYLERAQYERNGRSVGRASTNEDDQPRDGS